MRRRSAAVILLALSAPALAPAASPAPGTLTPAEARLESSLDGASTTPGEPADGSVRRWEYVVLLRTAPEVPNALGYAEVAAFKAGGAVLDDLRDVTTASHTDYRLLVRTRDPEAIHQVVRSMTTTRGVLGATATPLPETPTYPGGPSFFESYRAPDDRPVSNVDRVVVRHDVPPIADKKELLEMSDVLAPPSTGPDGPGGFTLNVSELFSRMKEGAWRRREDKLRATPIEILPPAPSPDDAAAANP